jgi:hypothetical protein
MSPGDKRKKSMAPKIKNKTERGELTTAPVTAPAASGATSLRDSEFFRLPRPGTRDLLSNLARTSILEYGEQGCFKLIRLRKRGSRRGIVLVDTKSFLAWLHGQPAVVTKEAQS